MDTNILVPFNFISEALVNIDGNELVIEVWEHMHTKKQFQIDRKNGLYRLFNPKNKKQDEYVKCPFINHLNQKFKRNN